MSATPGKRARIAILSAIIAALLYALLFYTPPHGGLWTQVFFDSLHVPVFGFIALSVYFLWQPEKPWPQRAAVALLVACALGLLSELAQTMTSRDASIRDFIADCLGAAGTLAITVALFSGNRLPAPWRAVLSIGGLVMLIWALMPLAAVSAAYVERDRQFPVVFDARSSFDRKLIRLQHVSFDIATPSGHDEAHARVTLREAPWPGIAFHDLRPDWSGYSVLVVDIGVEGDTPLTLSLRVHDAAHRRKQAFNDRFNRTLELDPGRRQIRISLDELRDAPQGREMDLTRISELIIFGSESDAERTFRLYGIRLE